MWIKRRVFFNPSRTDRLLYYGDNCTLPTHRQIQVTHFLPSSFSSICTLCQFVFIFATFQLSLQMKYFYPQPSLAPMQPPSWPGQYNCQHRQYLPLVGQHQIPGSLLQKQIVVQFCTHLLPPPAEKLCIHCRHPCLHLLNRSEIEIHNLINNF